MVRSVRHFASALLITWGVAAADRESAILIVGELGANAAQHGGAEMAVSLSLHGPTLCIEVSDSGNVPVARTSPCTARRDEECGRGLAIVDHLAEWVETDALSRRCTVRAGLRVTAFRTCKET
ncbi:ATP-binding protein [Streptomyces sp. NBC_00829]|uniref:ATP-binding protein n=1 Tax=Streptomyces sp. NBC_00829 TaxID=2903679 RepID=UPI003863ADE3|nr:ATP-binding protein [Streptomyces sp. NBC_00829]